MTHTTSNDSGEERTTSSLQTIIWQTVFFSLILVACVIIGAVFFKESLTDFAQWIVHHFGMTGLLVGVFLADTLTFPTPPDLLLFTAAASPDIPNIPMLLMISITSTFAGSVAYVLGPYLQRIEFLRRRIESFRSRGEALFARWGVWAVAIAALSPLPYSIICWFAGIYNMSYKRFFFATLFRIPRMVGYYCLFILGWSVTF